MEVIVEMNQISKSFKEKKAVDHISLNIHKGSIVAILGPNGAGKTTTLSMMLGMLEPTQGTVKIFGQHPKDIKVREKIGAMLQQVSVIDRLKVREVIELFRSYYPNPMEMEFLINLTGLTPSDLNRYAEKLSGGQKRCLSFALALAGNPELLFLDEPTVGLDTTARRKFWASIRELSKQGKTVVFTTHYLQEADDAADRILLISQGALVADGTPEEIKSRIVKRSLSFLSDQDSPEFRQRLIALPSIAECYDKDGRICVTTDNTDSVLAAIFTGGLPVRDVRIDQGRLDEAFEQLTQNHEEAV
ncbi:ABC-2 type transport system ATP-binding protein [Paenibacillus anaericanus]|uniref:ABC transporter ATP-binding protein n=1 Tax=Paenibacillus anaericanus TaxID=170367 RepID=UPI002785090D|nr:ABC transporter ATP-binding protein [Paenibacillus anaericanus]MDQ0091101.1 ABC-2 type transport system ATP-binding protein [Paenibacillus anaericanus]